MDQSIERGLVLLEQGKIDQAQKYFLEGLSTSPNNSEIFYLLGICECNKGDTELGRGIVG